MPIPLRWQWKIDRLRERVAGFFRSDPSNARPQMCPSCGTLVGIKATKCHVCGANLRFGLAAASRSLGSLLPSASPVTYCLLTLCCLFYGISVLLSIRLGASMMPEGGGLGALFNIGGIDTKASILLGSSLPLPYNLQEPWRLVTAVFLHGSLLHILFNMWVLMDIGPVVEELYGSARYFFLYITTGAAGYVASSFLGHVSVGASGALLGLIGLLLAATTKRGGMASQMLRQNLIRWVIYILVMGFMFSGIDNAAHIGGLAAGFGLGKIVADRQPHDAAERRRALALGWTTAVTVVACFVFMMMEFYQNR
ncbi:MAG TPA: rhomboid family intramembrane serine protease [Candidatus Acidoferrales bacterium]|nr:rhomboid family intramembrane serine protease [Candidatus Acidoferrales bacterium]